MDTTEGRNSYRCYILPGARRGVKRNFRGYENALKLKANRFVLARVRCHQYPGGILCLCVICLRRVFIILIIYS